MKIRVVLIVFLLMSALGTCYLLSHLHGSSSDVLSEQQKQQELTTLVGHAPRLVAPQLDQNWISRANEQSSLTFQYPAAALVYTEDNDAALKQPDVIESFSFQAPMSHTHVVIQQRRIDLQKLDEFSAVKIRTADAAFTREEKDVNGKPTVQFTKVADNIAEKDMFALNNSTVISVAVTGPDTDNVAQVFSDVLFTMSF